MRPAEAANCEPDDDEVMQLDTQNFSRAQSSSPSQDISDHDYVIDRQLEDISESSPGQCSDTESLSGAVIYDRTHGQEESVLRASAVTYLCGVVINSLEKKYHCNACGSSLCKENAILERNDELFVHFKAYNTKVPSDFGNLRVPSSEFRSVMDLCLTLFETIISDVITESGVKKTMLNKCVIEINNNFPNWLNSECRAHRRFCVERIIVIKLRYELKLRILSLPKMKRKLNKDQISMEDVQKKVRRKLFH